MFKKFSLILAVVTIIALLYSPSATYAYSTDFDSFAIGTNVEDINVPGMTFDSLINGDWDIAAPAAFVNMTGNQIEGCGSNLVIVFDTPQYSIDFDFGTIFSFPVTLDVYNNINLVASDSFTGTVLDIFPEGHASITTASPFDIVVISGPACMAIDNLVTAGAATSLNVPHVTQVRIDAGAPVTPYDSPAGSPVRLANGNTFMLPQDYDGSGFDTHIVTDTAVVDGVTWYSIFIGSEDFVWVRGDQVQDVGPNPQ